MGKRLLICLAMIALLCQKGNEFAMAQTASPWPVCQPWTPVPNVRPSPTILQDNTLFNVGGHPIDSDLSNGLLKSLDRGYTWQQVNSPRVGRIYFSSNYQDDRTWALLPWSGVQEAYISDDAGITWRTITLPRTEPNAFALGDAQHLYLGYGRELPPENRVPMELLVSSDGGQTWQRTFQGLEVDEIAVSPAFAQDHTVLMALGAYHYNGGLVMSTDGGLTWRKADDGIDLSGFGVKSLRFSPQFASDRTLFVYDFAQDLPGVYKSTDAGATWRRLPESTNLFFANAPQILLSPHYQWDQTLWQVDYYRASVSRDGGETWQVFTRDMWLQAGAEYCAPGGACGVELFGVALKRGATMEADQYSMYHSYDYGQTWQCLGPALNPVWLPLILK